MQKGHSEARIEAVGYSALFGVLLHLNRGGFPGDYIDLKAAGSEQLAWRKRWGAQWKVA